MIRRIQVLLEQRMIHCHIQVLLEQRMIRCHIQVAPSCHHASRCGSMAMRLLQRRKGRRREIEV